MEHRLTTQNLPDLYNISRGLREEIEYAEIAYKEKMCCVWSCLRCLDTPVEDNMSLLEVKKHIMSK
jgi:hypothetical protein